MRYRVFESAAYGSTTADMSLNFSLSQPCFPASLSMSSTSRLADSRAFPNEVSDGYEVGGNMPMEDATLVATRSRDGSPMLLLYYSTPSNQPWSDEDWGSAGPACFLQLKVCVAAGKDGIGYPVRTDNLGGTTLGTAGTAANYAKLAEPCVWLTTNPGPIPCSPPAAAARTLNFFPWETRPTST